MEKPLLLYVVYGSDEKEYFEHLNAHLAVSKRNGEIVVWERSEIAPGQEEQREIRSNEDEPYKWPVPPIRIADEKEKFSGCLVSSNRRGRDVFLCGQPPFS